MSLARRSLPALWLVGSSAALVLFACDQLKLPLPPDAGPPEAGVQSEGGPSTDDGGDGGVIANEAGADAEGGVSNLRCHDYEPGFGDVYLETRRLELPAMSGGLFPDDIYVQVAWWAMLGVDSGYPEGPAAGFAPNGRTFVFTDAGTVLHTLVGQGTRFARATNTLTVDSDAGKMFAVATCPKSDPPPKDTFPYVYKDNTIWICVKSAPGEIDQGECFIFVRQGLDGGLPSCKTCDGGGT